MLKFKKEDGLTLVELLVVIALVGVVAAIALPILTNVLSGAQTDADANSGTNVAQFESDWTAAGYTLKTDSGVIYATDGANGPTIAQIKEAPAAN